MLQNECKEWKNVFLHENRLLTNLLNYLRKKMSNRIKLINYMLS